MGIARKIRDEYGKAGTIVEQAISSVRTVYSFVGESKTIAAYSNALQGTVDLGLKQLEVRSLVGDRMALLIQTISSVTIACTMGLVIAWRLAWVMIAVQPLIIVCYYCKRLLLKSMSKKSIKAQEESSKLAAEAVSNLRTVTAFSSQARILQMLKKAQEGPQRESIRQSWFSGIGLGTSNSLMTCTWALDFWYGGKLMAEGYIGAKALFQTFMILVSTGRVIADAGTMTNDLAKGADAVGLQLTSITKKLLERVI
ncbi:hypothetical protein K7X08_019222 [Anisodus acutangulus]|uniref:ABC transmembrane type-1 domain-containing protein n=1 Tax=Anisodus acutangulus TaxID=402998 RepID=A0A9Q1RPU1_9SOLA|nr:hypothetical protein K7X08_019222 [Anisodus acutangulus]